MAALKDNDDYQRYKEEVGSRRLTLPPYEKMGNCVHIEYGELYCRVPKCGKGRKQFSATNNLRTHILSHDGYEISRTSGGRVSQKEVDRAARFYESLFKEETAISLPSPDLGATSPELSIPSPPIELHTSSAEMESPSPITKPETPCSSRLQVGSETEERKVLLPEQNGNKQVNLTKLRAMAKDLGIEIPCRKCKENESSVMPSKKA